MTLDKSTQDGPPDSTILSIISEKDLAILASIISPSGDDPAESADGLQPQVAELLKHITTADKVAKGVEGRLDGIIENLDLLLSALEQDSENQQDLENQQPLQASAVIDGKGDRPPSS